MKKRIRFLTIYLLFILLIFCYLFYLAQTVTSDLVVINENQELVIKDPITISKLVQVEIKEVKVVTDTAMLGDEFFVKANDDEEFVYVLYTLTSQLDDVISVCPTSVLYEKRDVSSLESYYPEQSKVTTYNLSATRDGQGIVDDRYDYQDRNKAYNKKSNYTELKPNQPTYFQTIFRKSKSESYAYGISLLTESFNYPTSIESIVTQDNFNVLEVKPK